MTNILQHPRSLLTLRNWELCALSCGNLYGLTLLVAFAASGMIPPTAPDWKAEKLHAHIFSHVHGIQAGCILLIASGAFYIPWSAMISKQMRQIAHLDHTLADLQLTCAAAGYCAFLFPATCLGLMTFRDYGPELTQLISDVFWISAFIPWPLFVVQYWTVAWASFADQSDPPVFSKAVGWVNLIAPVIYAFAAGVHVHRTGSFAWNGGLVFWPTVAFIALQISFDSLSLIRNVRRKAEQEGRSLDGF
ncbi:hypothetical protein BJX96DRAFT_176394 [Aspergillus floccosus]